MNAAIEKESPADPLERCTVVVIYDDVMTRARALSACDCLVNQIWESVELDFHWWRTDFLADPYMADAAAQYSLAADFLIVCSRPAEKVSSTLVNWFESWIGKRNGREGAFIDLTTAKHAANHSHSLGRHDLLRDIARRGSFDYLSVVEPSLSEKTAGQPAPPNPPRPIDNRLAYSRPPSRFGLNE